MQNGGKRKGAGRPKGSKDKKPRVQLVEKAAMRAELRALVAKEIVPMTLAQIAHAKGIKYLVVREKKGGKFLRVTPSMDKAKLGRNEEIVEVWEKDPSIQAFTDLMNRATDKPKEQDQTINLAVTGDIVARLHEARKKAAGGKSG